jgi:aerobic-type carbon monoxide dehydrogenase small subunit (CoxS/CutS family)
MERSVAFSLNGKPVRVKTDDERMLLWVLRSDLGLTGTKFGCGEGHCGACTVVVDKEAVLACSTPLRAVAGRQVLTVEGLAEGDRLHRLQQTFLEHHAFQCGFCTPGMLMRAYALLLKKPRPSRNDIAAALEGNLCRCGSHVRILEAVETAGGAK